MGHDIVIIGAGLCGTWAAKELTEAGAKVLLLEAGPDIAHRSLTEFSTQAGMSRESRIQRQFIQCQHWAYWQQNPAFFVDDLENPYSVLSNRGFIWIRGRQVGGRGLTWGGVTLRFSDYEFGAAALDGFGAEWPISYADLAPFYDRVESTFGVCGTTERLPQLPDGIFLTPPALTDAELRFKEQVELRWPDRKVIHCRGVQPDLPHALSNDSWPHRTVQARILPDALRTGNLEVKPDSIASHLLMDPGGRRIAAISCIDRKTKSSFVVPARIVALCASSIESVRLLLNSRHKEHPSGVGNSSGHLGRWLLDHAPVIVSGDLPASAQALRQRRGGAHGILVPRFRNIGAASPEFLRGYGIWGNLGRGDLGQNGARWTLCAQSEVLAHSENHISLSATRTDAWGIPIPVISLQYGENERRLLDDAECSLREMAQMLDWPVTSCLRLPPGAFVHELGGARMGASSATSVLDPYNRCWDTENLFVLDGSCFVTSGWQNPTLTIMAIAGRACQTIIEEINHGRA